MSYLHPDLLFRLLAAHLVADFMLQSVKWITSREQHGFKSGYLYLHVLVVFILSYLALGSWQPVWLPVTIAATHYAADLLKSLSKSTKIPVFLADQFFHIAVIVVCWLIYTSQLGTFRVNFEGIFNNTNVWILITGYIVATTPMSILIGKMTTRWNDEVNAPGKIEGLKDAGKWIGIMERVLILTFTLTGKIEAIGFILAAKSVFWFGELKDSADKKRTEYILIGTLISFSSAILLGIIIKAFI